MTPAGFDRFVGIDWSGSKAGRLKGIRVASCRADGGAPCLLNGPRPGGLWRRADVLEFVRDAAVGGRRMLVGFDFAFAYAHADLGAYFPGLEASPPSVRDLWALVESLAGDAPDLYGGTVYAPGSPVAGHYWTSGRRPDGFVERRRRTELACGRVTWPHPVFKCFSAANVGTGSLAGMRLLHRLGDRATVWPFDAPGPLTVVEIFPRLYVKRAGQDPRRLHERPPAVDAVLAAYASAPWPGPPLATEDEVDAVVSSAAVRWLSAVPEVWAAPAAEPAAGREGWIFGVDFANPKAP